MIELSETTKRQAGDCLPENVVIQLPEEVSFDLRRNDLSDLGKIWEGWSAARRQQFSHRYGHIGFLAMVSVMLSYV